MKTKLFHFGNGSDGSPNLDNREFQILAYFGVVKGQYVPILTLYQQHFELAGGAE